MSDPAGRLADAIQEYVRAVGGPHAVVTDTVLIAAHVSPRTAHEETDYIVWSDGSHHGVTGLAAMLPGYLKPHEDDEEG